MNKVRRALTELLSVASERNYKDARVWNAIDTLQQMLLDELMKAAAR